MRMRSLFGLLAGIVLSLCFGLSLAAAAPLDIGRSFDPFPGHRLDIGSYQRIPIGYLDVDSSRARPALVGYRLMKTASGGASIPVYGKMVGLRHRIAFIGITGEISGYALGGAVYDRAKTGT